MRRLLATLALCTSLLCPVALPLLAQRGTVLQQDKQTKPSTSPAAGRRTRRRKGTLPVRFVTRPSERARDGTAVLRLARIRCRASSRRLARTHQTPQFPLHAIFRIWRWTAFQPQILRISWITAELQRDEMVFLVVLDIAVGVAIFANLLSLGMKKMSQNKRGIPDGRRQNNRRGGRID